MQNKKLLLICGLIISSINSSYSRDSGAPEVREENLIIRTVSHIGGVPDCYATEVNFHFPEYPLLTSKLSSSVGIQEFYWKTMDTLDRLLDQKIAEIPQFNLGKYERISENLAMTNLYGIFGEAATYDDVTHVDNTVTPKEFREMNTILQLRAQVETYEEEYQQLQSQRRDFDNRGVIISLDNLSEISGYPTRELVERYQSVVQDIFNNILAEEHEE